MPRLVLLGCLLAGIAAALSIAGFAVASRSATSPTIDPRLILHPHTVTAAASLRDIGVAHLQMYPGIPGQQRVHLVLPASVHASSLTVRATMVGMAMPSVSGTLTRHGNSYRGKLRLAMFGRYRLQIRLPARGSFAFRVALSLPAL